MKARLMGGPLLIGGSDRNGAAACGNNEDSILGDELPDAVGVAPGMLGTKLSGCDMVGISSIGCSKLSLELRRWLILLFALYELMLSLSSFIWPGNAGTIDPSGSLCPGLSYRLATLGMGGRTGACRLTGLFLFSLLITPSLVFGRRLSPLGLYGVCGVEGFDESSKSKFICNGLTKGGALEVLVAPELLRSLRPRTLANMMI